MRIIILSIALLFCAFSAHSQVLKSAGVWYFLDVDSMTARPAVLPNGTELAYVVGTKTVYYWNRNTSTWTAYGSTFGRDSIYFDSSIIGSGTVGDPWRVDSTLFATIAGVGDSIANALLGYLPIEGGTLTGTGGAGFIGFPSQVSAPGTPASGLNVYAQGSSFNWKGTDGFERLFASTLTGGRTYTLPDVSGTFALGTGTTNRVPLWTATNTLGNSNIQDNGTAVSILNSKPFFLGQWTTAGRPTGVNGYMGYNTTFNWLDVYSSSGWFSPLQSSLTGGIGTSGSVIYLDANGRATQDNTKLFYNNTSNIFRVKGNASTAGSTFDPSASNILKLELMADSNTDNVGGAIVWGGNSNIGGAAIKYQLVSGVGAGSLSFYTRQGLADASLTRQVTIDYTGLFTVEKNAILKGDVTMGRVRINNFNSGGPGIYGNITEGIQSNGTYQNSQAAIKFDFLSGNYDFQTAPVGTVNTTPTLTSRMYLTNTGLLRLGGTATTSYQLDVQGTNAIRIPVGTTAQTPTESVGIIRYNSDSTAYQGYAGSSRVYFATRAYARSLVSAIPTSNIYTSDGSLTGNRTFNGGAFDLRLQTDVTVGDSLKVANLPSHTAPDSIVTTKGGWLGKKKFLLLSDSLYYQRPANSGFIFDKGYVGYQTSGNNYYGLNYADTTGYFETATYKSNGDYSSIWGRSFVGSSNFLNKSVAGGGTSITVQMRPSFGWLLSRTTGTTRNLVYFDTSGFAQFYRYGVGRYTAAALSKTQSNYIAGFATDGTVLDLERKRDTTIFVTADSDYDFSAAVTTAQIGSRYNRIIIHMTLTSGVGADKTTTLHTPDANLMQCEILIRGTDNTGTYDNEIAFGTNNAISSDGTNTSGYTLAQGQGLHVRVVYNGSAYKYIYY